MSRSAAPVDRSRIKVAITETNVADWSGGWRDVNNLGHALVLFETIGRYLLAKDVDFSQLWTTRWMENNSANPPEVWDALGKSNNLNPTGRTVSIWSNSVFSKMLATTQTSKIRSFASYDPGQSMVAVLIENKDVAPHLVSMVLDNAIAGATPAVSQNLFGGTSADDTAPTWQAMPGLTISANTVSFSAPPLSVTVLKFSAASTYGNLVTNQGFEFGALGWTSMGNMAVVNANSKSGAYSLRVGPGQGGQYQYIAVDPNRSYMCRAFAKVGSLGEQAWVGLTVEDKAGQQSAYSQQVTTNAYVQYVFNFTTPANVKRISVWTWKATGSSYLYVDDYKCN